MFSKQNLKLAILVTLAGLVFLVASKSMCNFPTRLATTLAIFWLGWSTLYWIVRGKSQRSPGPLVAQIVLAWSSTAMLLLAAVYHVDRAGWIWYQLTGYDEVIADDCSHLADLSPATFVARNPWFTLAADDSTRIVLPRGQYEVRETIVVPRAASLTIEPGTILRFAAGRSLLAYCPIVARGTEQEPIVFTALNPWLKWGAVGVVHPGESVFEHAHFRHGRRAVVNHIELLAGLSLVESKVEILNCRFQDMFGKDAVWVLRGDVLIRNNVWRDIYRDGLDLDGGSGEISDNHFVNCQDEGIDLSDNVNVQVLRNTVLDTKGGRIGTDHQLAEIEAANTLGYLSPEPSGVTR